MVVLISNGVGEKAQGFRMRSVRDKSERLRGLLWLCSNLNSNHWCYCPDSDNLRIDLIDVQPYINGGA